MLIITKIDRCDRT